MEITIYKNEFWQIFYILELASVMVSETDSTSHIMFTILDVDNKLEIVNKIDSNTIGSKSYQMYLILYAKYVS